MKTVLVTGAAGHLGHAVVRKFLEEDYQVAAVHLPDEQLDIEDERLQPYEADASDAVQMAEVVEEVQQKFGAVDFGALLAGGFGMGDIKSTSVDDLHKFFHLNFETAYVTAQTLYKHMEQQGTGHLALIAAKPVFDHELGKGTVAYTLSKSLLNQLAGILNAAGKQHNIRASVVAPSIMDTPPNREGMPNANFDDWPKVEEVAEALAFLASGKASAWRESLVKIYGNL